MLTKGENNKLERKLLNNKLLGKEPSTKNGLAKMLGVSRQTLNYIQNKPDFSAKGTTDRLILWINEK